MQRHMLRLCLTVAVLSVGNGARSQDVEWAAGGFTDDVSHVAFAPDGSYLAVSSWDGWIRFFDPTTLMQVRSFRGDWGAYMFDISSDGRYIAAGRHTVSIWDATTGELVKTLPQQAQRVPALTFSPGGILLAMAGYDSTIRLWDVTSSESLATFRGHQGKVLDVIFSSDGSTLLSAGADSTIRLWDVGSRSLTRTISAGNSLTGVRLSPDGRLIIAVVGYKTIMLWNADTGVPSKQYPISGTAYRAQFSPDGKYFCYGGATDSILTIRDVATGQVVSSSYPDFYGVRYFAYAPDGRTIITTGRLANLWDLSSGSRASTVNGHTGPVRTVAFSPLGQYVASGGDDAQIIVRAAATGQPLRSFYQGSFNRVTSLSFSTDEQLLASASGSLIQIWCTGSWDTLRTMTNGRSVTSIAFAPASHYLASATSYDSVRLMDASTGTSVRTFAGSMGIPVSLSFSPDGKLLAAAESESMKQLLRVWDVSTGSIVKDINLGVVSVAFSPDNQSVAAGLADRSVKVWRLPLWEPLLTIPAGSAVMDFSPDAKYLVTGSDSGWAKIWDLTNGACVKTCWCDTAVLWDVAFSPKGTSALSGMGSGTLILWNTGLSAVGFSDAGIVKDRFRLGHNYPNPFNGTTVITFELPTRSLVQVSVYDILGREVAVLADGVLPAGEHSVRFEGRNVASGVYFCRLRSGACQETRRMVLMR